jgi:hypothetical protein
MTVFEHSFTLIGLVLGLALAHVLSALLTAIRTEGFKSLGLLTPLLAIFFIADTTTFWGILWEMRADLQSIWPVLGFGILLSSLYYIAAVLIFPQSRVHWPDLDTYYMRYRRLVLGIMFICFGMVVALGSWQKGTLFSADTVALTYFIVLAATIIVPWKWANAVGLSALIVVDVWAFTPFG